MKLSDYCKEIYITPTEKLGEGYRAYCMDGGNKGRGSDCDMAHHVGLTSCHCCDYFLQNDGDNILFLEIKDILQTKQTFAKRYSKIPRNANGNAELFMWHIANECVLKLYGSMLVLCWFARCCSSEGARLRPKQYHFFLIVPDASRNKDAKMMDGIKRRLDDMKNIASKKHSAYGIVRDMDVLNAEEFEKKLKSGAVPPT